MREPAKIDQTEFGPGGNCQSACLATLLGIPLEAVPKFHELWHDGNAWYSAMRDWLHSIGWGIISIVPWQGLPWPPAHGYYIAAGVTNRGNLHAVIFKDGRLWHDPHPERAGIMNVEEVDILYPLNPLEFKRNA